MIVAAGAAPWAAAQEEFRRREREFQLSLTGRAAEFPRAPVSTEIRRYTRASGDRTEMVCYQCKGKWHMAKNCPTGDPTTRKSGKTCRDCGGMGRYARERRTPVRMRTGGGSHTSSTSAQQQEQRSQRLNGGA